jgi:hypothetical protein
MTPAPAFAILIGGNQLRSETVPDETQLFQEIQNLTIKLLALRDVTVCLLATQARANDDPTTLFREISESLDKRLGQTIPETANPQVVAMGEQIRAEVDRVIGMARRALGHGTS